MILTRFLACAVALALAPSAFANALEAAPSKPATPEALPAGAQVARLEVNPAQLTLTGKYESAQVIVTARLASGEVADVTRIATYRIDGGSVEIGASGLVKPLKNGASTLKVTLGNHTADVPVSVVEVRDAQPVDFIRDVNPVMTKAGCNAGACHGAKDGKYGFKLSLRGYDPLFDVRSLKDDLASRRLNAAQPDDSLMLLKATSGVPHEGGQRFKLGDKYYEIMRAWIADGAKLDLKSPRVTGIEVFPKDPVVQQVGARQQVRVVATYADGKKRDVTAEAFVESGNTDVAKTDGGGLVESLRRGEAPLLARYEGSYAATTLTVMGDRSGFTWKAPETWGRIDALVAAKWERMKIEPSGVCSDTEYLRRAHLDLTGLPPSAEEVRAFAADTRPLREKREALVDRLIGSPEFVEHWTNKWSDMLQVNAKFLGGEGTKLFREWIKKEVAANTPYDQFVRAIVTATGSNKENPAASYWKILRDPAEALENTTHLFLATRFNCNKCHDHPFERWTQDQYYQLGAYFSQVALMGDPASGKQVIVGTAVEKARPLFEIVKDAPKGDMIHLRTNKVAEPSFPYPATAETKGARREQLAAWMTSPDNRYFASSYANRIWGYLTGVGLIEPLDDIRAGNPPTNPELLEYLTKEFIGSQFDVRHLMRIITKSRTYQLSVATNKWNEDDRINYSHALARRLPAEVLYDSVLKVTGSAPKLPGGMRAGLLPDGGTDLPSGFLANLGRPPRESSCECERSNDLQLGGVMALLSGPAVGDAIGDTKNALAKLVADQPDDTKLVDEVFHRVLNRPARETEVKKTLATWAKIDTEHQALNADLAAKEAEQAPIIAKMEADRVAAITAAKTELARYEKEIAPKVAEAEKVRVAEVAKADAAVKEYAKTKLAPARAHFEATVPVTRTYTGWQLLDPNELRSTNLGTLTKQPDGSIKAGDVRPNNADYTILADTALTGITGLLLEVLPSPDDPQFGPGRANGNFVLGEIAVKYGPGRIAQNDAELADAIASVSQERFDVKTAIDGKKGDNNNGWAVGKSVGAPQFAAFAFKTPIKGDKTTRLRIDLNMPRPGGFTIGRFRLWVTTSAQPLNIGLPHAVAEALKKPANVRSKEDQAAIAAYWEESDPALSKLRLTFGKHQLPLPTDPGIVERRAALAKAEAPIRLDPRLVQLRQDAEQSKLLMGNKRLTAVQDLTWALINTPAFLFNH
jgi:hypothetical protein